MPLVHLSIICYHLEVLAEVSQVALATILTMDQQAKIIWLVLAIKVLIVSLPNYSSAQTISGSNHQNVQELIANVSDQPSTSIPIDNLDLVRCPSV